MPITFDFLSLILLSARSTSAFNSEVVYLVDKFIIFMVGLALASASDLALASASDLALASALALDYS